MYQQRIKLRNISQYLFLSASILKSCLASLEESDEFMADQSLYDQEVEDGLESSQEKLMPQDFLPDYYDTTRILGYARLLRYSVGRNITDTKHPIAKNLSILFKCFSRSINDANEVIEAVKKLNWLLKNIENRNYTHEEKNIIYYVSILKKLRDSLSDAFGETAFNNYMKYRFLNENYALFRYSSARTHLFQYLNHSQSINSKMLLNQSPVQMIDIEFNIRFDSLLPKYLHFNVIKDRIRRANFISLENEYYYRYVDQNKVCLYKLVGALTQEGKGVCSYLKENGTWNRYINNKKIKEKIWIPIPFIILYEKYAEYHRNSSEGN